MVSRQNFESNSGMSRGSSGPSEFRYRSSAKRRPHSRITQSNNEVWAFGDDLLSQPIEFALPLGVDPTGSGTVGWVSIYRLRLWAAEELHVVPGWVDVEDIS